LALYPCSFFPTPPFIAQDECFQPSAVANLLRHFAEAAATEVEVGVFVFFVFGDALQGEFGHGVWVFLRSKINGKIKSGAIGARAGLPL
jgi:hypothetical protein